MRGRAGRLVRARVRVAWFRDRAGHLVRARVRVTWLGQGCLV